MSGEERGELLAHLKAKWAAVNAAYLKIGFVLDIEVRRGDWGIGPDGGATSFKSAPAGVCCAPRRVCARTCFAAREQRARHHRPNPTQPLQSKIKRKEMLEAELASIEADIKLLQRGDVVMVMHDA